MSKERYRVWADLEAPDGDAAERRLRGMLDGNGAAYGATGKTEYNGWRNYETWAVNLWLDNEEPTYEHARTLARQALADANDRSEVVESVGIDRDSSAVSNLADKISGWVGRELLPDLGPTLAADLLNAARSEVDWYEIAEHLLEEVRGQ